MSPVEWTPEQVALRDRVLLGEEAQAPAEGERYCRSCDSTKPLDQFTRDRSDSSGYSYRCRVCNRTRPSTIASQRARQRLVNAHRDEYEALYAEEKAKLAMEGGT